MVSFAVLSNMKENQEKFHITSIQQKHFFKVTYLIICFQLFLTGAMLANIGKEFTTLTDGVINSDGEIIVAKLLTTLTLHIFLFPAFINTHTLMKYVNNHQAKFENPFVCFYMAGMTMIVFWICEFVNLMVLYSKTSVFNTVNSFVTQTCVINLQTYYYSSMFQKDMSNNLKTIFDNMPPIEWRNCERKFSDRCMFGKFNRLLYLICRFFFVVVLYYFGPHVYMIVTQFRGSISVYQMASKM